MATAYNASVVTSGLVLCLDAGNSRSYPGTGTAWTDLTGGGRNGTLTNGPTYSNANGGAIVFDGTNDQIEFGSSSAIQFYNRDPYTLEAWVYVSVAPTTFNYPGIFSRYGSPGRSGWGMAISRNDTTTVSLNIERWENSNFIGGAYYNTNTTDLVNKWWHMLGTYDGTNVIFYVNGKASDTQTSTTNITNSTATLQMGTLYGNMLNGRISNARIYNRALTAAEVVQNFNALRPRFGI